MNTAPTAPGTSRLDLARLQALAQAHRIGTSFSGWDRQPHDVAPETLVKIIAGLGVKAGTDELLDAALEDAELAPWRRMLPPAVVGRAGTETLVPVHVRHGEPVRLWIEAEDGGRHHPVQRDLWVNPRLVDGVLTGRATFELPRDLPLGWHVLHAASGDRHTKATLVVVPQRLTTAAPLEQRRGWGLAAQLYSVRSKRSWGIGDFADLADLAALGGGHGADFVLVNPLHAAEPAPPLQPSPYSPSTRRFFNPLYLRIEAVPELAYLKRKLRRQVDELAKQVHPLNLDAGKLDRDTAYAAKLEALELLYAVERSPARQQSFEAFRAQQGSGLEDFALWSALREELGPEDPFWQDFGGPASVAAEQARARLADRVGFHCWLQWLCDEQLESAQRAATAAGMRLGVVHDLAVGADLASADAWTLRPVLVPGMSVGAPPDMYNQQGQDWSQPPWHPQRLAEAGYAPLRDMLRTVLRHAGGVRVDHILGLFRLWWVPEGNAPGDGAYVYYDHEALVGILALEAERAGAVVIGEDLGTVEPWVRDYLAERGILGTSILWFESDDAGAPLPPEAYRALCLASVNTHDLPPTAGYLAGEHVRLRDQLGLLNRALTDEQALHEEALAAVLDLVRRRGLLPADTGRLPDGQVIEALYRLLAQSPSVLLGVSLVDAVGERRAQNQPGTRDEYPNWRVPLADAEGDAVLIEDLAGDARFGSLLAAVEESLRRRQPA
ncbi:4-alpha-glucanotransferase [Arthrobacter sp. I2-34]|uniref:4-alpha-glucanotransferase n=1 Tax=Arthrobacter hankyongi TaxID=2904801 RepID=A0ABS9L8V6_9MICC|nr:4-alpha-glucanotransferase [Arthrobacter hankyongi]MCG2622919.1 4-alpha-glucanotransferase [Arthrobacter hankyongi]